jgi:hypothetical protein
MKRNIGAKDLLLKARNEAKKQEKKRVKRLDKRHAKKLVGTSAAPPAQS